MGNREWEKMPWPQNKANAENNNVGNFGNPEFVSAIKVFTETYKDKKKVLICEPSIGVIDYQAHESCIDLGRLMVAYSREKFCEVALAFGFDYILFIDDDHIWPHDMFERLEKNIDKYDILAPLCVQRAVPYFPVMYKSKYIPPTKEGDPWTFDNEKILDFKKGEIVECDAVGFGACIIKVDLLRKIPTPWFFSMSAIGEDILFCGKAKQYANAKIAVDTSIDTGHLKDREPVFWRDYDRGKKESDLNYAELEKRRNEKQFTPFFNIQHNIPFKCI
jgi:hypothetical protein